MTNEVDNRTEVSCNMTQTIYNRWRDAIQSSVRHPSLNSSLHKFHQSCKLSKDLYYRDDHENCTTTMDMRCRLAEPYKKNLTCPFSYEANSKSTFDDGMTYEECECFGIKKNNAQKNDSLNCICNVDYNSYMVVNYHTSGNYCTENFFFTKHCVVEEPDMRKAIFSMNCTFLNCSSVLEQDYFNVTTSPLESCNDYRPIKIIPEIREANATITTIATSTIAPTTKTTETTTLDTTKTTETTMLDTTKTINPLSTIIPRNTASGISETQTEEKTIDSTSTSMQSSTHRSAISLTSSIPHSTFLLKESIQKTQKDISKPTLQALGVPISEAQHSNNLSPLSLSGIILCVVLLQILFMGCIGFILKKRQRQNNKRETQDQMEQE